jgi:hypothetical protein
MPNLKLSIGGAGNGGWMTRWKMCDIDCQKMVQKRQKCLVDKKPVGAQRARAGGTV